MIRLINSKSRARMVLMALALPLSALAQPQPDPGWMPTHSHAPDVSLATPGAALQAGEEIHITVSLQIRNKSRLDALTAKLIAGTSTATLSSAAFLSQYAPSPDQVSAVVAHLTQTGFINIVVSPNRLLITADGSAATAKAAFNTELKHFTVEERSAYANVTDPLVPKALSGIVLAVHGLQTVHLAHTARVALNKLDHRPRPPAFTGAHSPAAWPAIYNANSIPTAANTTIGIISAGDMTQTLRDLATFVRMARFAPPVVSTVATGSASTRHLASSSADTAEWDLDSQDALGAAGGVVKSLVFYVANTLADADLTAAYNAVVAANVATVINVSLGECETDAQTSGTEATDDQIFEAAVAQGQTFVVATGDAGSYSCGSGGSAQSYPAVSPYVIAVGGTSLSTSPSGVWAAETVWSCGSAASCISNGATGGGVSLTEDAPSWQLASNVLGASLKRGVPDLAFDADPATGALPIVYGRAEQYGGTSLATPIFVGFWARIQSAHGNRLAFPAAAIYKYGSANQATLFHDIISGSNGGYTAAKGWDYTTGFGSLNVANFAAFVTSSGGF